MSDFIKSVAATLENPSVPWCWSSGVDGVAVFDATGHELSYRWKIVFAYGRVVFSAAIAGAVFAKVAPVAEM